MHAVVTMSRLRHPDPADTDAGELVKPEVALFLTDWAGVLHALLHTGRELLVELSEASCLSPAPWGCTSGRTASL